MSHPSRRSFSWSAALRTIKSDRAPVVPGLLAARGLASAYARSRNLPLNLIIRTGKGAEAVVTRAYDRKAIMTVATLAARDHQKRHGGTWTALDAADKIIAALDRLDGLEAPQEIETTSASRPADSSTPLAQIVRLGDLGDFRTAIPRPRAARRARRSPCHAFDAARGRPGTGVQGGQ